MDKFTKMTTMILLLGSLLFYRTSVSESAPSDLMKTASSFLGSVLGSRDSESSFDNGVMKSSLHCFVQCQVNYAPAWTAAMTGGASALLSSGLGGSGAKQLDIANLLKHGANISDDERQDRFEKLCKVHSDYVACLGLCPQGVLRHVIQSGLATLGLLCEEKHDEYVESMPCLVKEKRALGKACEPERARLDASSLLLHSSLVNTPAKLSTVLEDFCAASTNESRCTVPEVSSRCGSKAAGLTQAVLAQSLRVFLSRPGLPLPDNCRRLLHRLSETGLSGGLLRTSTVTTVSPPETQVSDPISPLRRPPMKIQYDYLPIHRSASPLRSFMPILLTTWFLLATLLSDV
jgi:hypothetical protein